jgi:deazaflavin-dependent oxidoreductase (nitroreductase family)
MPDGTSLRDLPYLYLTTIGRKTGLRREIEIWFVMADGKLYVLAEHFRKTNWVRNIEQEPAVHIRLGALERDGRARILDETLDAREWRNAQGLSRQKYGWGEGLPVEILPNKPFEPTPFDPAQSG